MTPLKADPYGAAPQLAANPKVTITSPASGTRVPFTFCVSGTVSGTVTSVDVSYDCGSGPVTAGSATVSSGGWKKTVTLPSSCGGASVTACPGGSSMGCDTVTGLTPDGSLPDSPCT